jgi:hypothetical protein
MLQMDGDFFAQEALANGVATDRRSVYTFATVLVSFVYLNFLPNFGMSSQAQINSGISDR